MRRAAALAALVALASCDGEEPTDAGVDAGPEPVDLTFEADPDPAELTGCTEDPPGPGVARAKHVSCARELPEGSLAMGRVGDIVLENARARFVVRAGEGSATTIGAPAGGVVDAALAEGPDLLKELFPLFDLVSIDPSAIEVVDAGGDDEARVRVLFEDAPIAIVDTAIPGLAMPVNVRGQLDYVLRADEDVLRLELSLTTREGRGRAGAAVGVIALLGGQELFAPGSGVLTDENLGGPGSVVLGERPTGAMALTFEDEASEVTHVETIHIVRGSRVTIGRGQLSTFEARLGLGATAADALRAARPPVDPVLTLTGAPGDRVAIEDASGVPWLRTSFDASGRARVALPPGDYRIVPGFDGYFEGDPIAHTHDADAELAVPRAPSAELVVAALVESAPDAPVRVTVLDGAEERERFVALGETAHRLPPGDHHVVVSHGLEHDVHRVDVSLADGASQRVEPDLPRVLDTTGWVSVDLHLHSDLSTDSVHAVEDAVRLLAAEGVQAAAATDHDFITDYAAVGARAGVDSFVALASGVEVSTTRFGHLNGYPLTRDPSVSGAGAPVWFDMSPSDVFASLRARGDASLGGALVQINHPRLGDASFFGALELDRATGHFTADPETLGLPAGTDLDDFGFEVIEVWNGYTRGGNEESFEDYLALFAAGRRFTMVGNSDSHIPDRPPGSPRSFVRVSDEASFEWGDLREGLARGGAGVTVAASIFVTAELMGPAAGDAVPVHVTVQAPPWASVDRLRIYAGTTATVDRAIAASSDPVRLDEVIDVPLMGSDFVVVRADGTGAPTPMQHFDPVGVANPLVVP